MSWNFFHVVIFNFAFNLILTSIRCVLNKVYKKHSWNFCFERIKFEEVLFYANRMGNLTWWNTRIRLQLTTTTSRNSKRWNCQMVDNCYNESMSWRYVEIWSYPAIFSLVVPLEFDFSKNLLTFIDKLIRFLLILWYHFIL